MKERLFSLPVGKITTFLKRYKFVLLVMLAGIIVLLIPTESEKSVDSDNAESTAGEDFFVQEIEAELSKILSKVEGAGEVSVMLTIHSGTERILAMDRELSAGDKKEELCEEIVIVSKGGEEEPVLVRRNYPVFRGALVVCSGGDNPEVVLTLTKALSALTGLSSSRITVCKGS